ncbi:MAG: hypothetical protein O7B81_15280 [Gammaproteobacteria bacterium]|nr:hypothetical protein [Gammaproteobacteria bacterium]MCZ6770428.1 hypothetical protein [Pseudomonadota bacterium]MCZ6893693.1 hypothetical protein [Gammaproteobacteria bacterium]
MSVLRLIIPGVILIALLVTFGLPVGATEGPTRPNSIVFNHTVAFAAEPEVTLPLYLTRRGQYFAEVYFERAPHDRGGSLETVNVSYSIDVFRRGELLFTRAFDHAVTPNQRAATLFRINTDRELPLKTNLDLVVRFGESTPRARATIEALTFHIQLKPNVKGRF